MDRRVPQPAPSRRQFLAAAGTLTASGLLLPTAGCRKPAPVPPTEAADGLTLRATSFRAAPDGRERVVWSYNGQFPGPMIRVKDGDTVRVKLVNELDVPTSIHWHGMHQPGTWRMDGVDGISAPPVPPGGEFVYEYRATPAGTHWYHSHVGVQYGDGLFGPLVVEEQTPIAKYDRDELLLLNDWFLEPAETLLATVIKGGMEKMPGKMEMKGRKDAGDVPFQSGLVNGKGRAPGNTTAPLTEVAVKKGETLRLRLVNGSSTYALRFQIDGHPLTVIATDGPPVKPVAVDNLVVNVGERYDVLLEANQSGAHWIRAVTLDGNEIRAVLRYSDAPPGEPVPRPVQWGPRALKAEDLRSREPAQLAANPREIPFLLGGSMMPFRWSINDQYYPKADPIEIANGETVRFALRNPTGMDHPFHMHGHSFRVLGKPGALNLTDPPLKDTVNVPAGGEVVLELLADNPGRWFFHCHIEWHVATGMARVLEIKPFE